MSTEKKDTSWVRLPIFHCSNSNQPLLATFTDGIFVALLIGTRVCVPNRNDAMNEILDLQRDLHANDFALCEGYTFGTRTLLFAFPFCQ